MISGKAAKAEVPLAVLYRRYVEPVAGGSHLDLLLGLYTPAPRVPGHAVQSIDWYHPTLEELDLAVESGEAAELRSRRLKEARLAAEARARAALQSHRKVRRQFETALAGAQRLQPLREEQALDFTLGWPVLRRAVAILANELVQRRAIDEPGEVFFLTREEALASGTGLSETARRRRAVWERQRMLTPPLVVGEVDRMTQAATDFYLESRQGKAATPDTVAGIAASAGRATGPVRVIRRIEDFDRLQPGDILVAPATTPAWTPLFVRAAAVVTDGGSLGSHSSQVAREYGIPAVVCTADATRRLSDGQLVTVDGSAGVVTPAA